jgi:hypothetical protein
MIRTSLFRIRAGLLASEQANIRVNQMTRRGGTHRKEPQR